MRFTRNVARRMLKGVSGSCSRPTEKKLEDRPEALNDTSKTLSPNNRLQSCVYERGLNIVVARVIGMSEYMCTKCNLKR